jgi:hypothetical protein
VLSGYDKIIERQGLYRHAGTCSLGLGSRRTASHHADD